MSVPNIVITDGFTLNPGDLSWTGIQSLGNLTLYDRTTESEVVPRCKNANIIITNKTPITKEVIVAAEALQLIAVTATGYNVVDIQAARAHHIPVCNVPEYGTYSVAQHTWALILELTNHVGLNNASVKQGAWSASPDFSYSKKPLVELCNKTLGVVGMGRIGQQVATIARAMGMKVIYSSRSPKQEWPNCVPLTELFAQSDVISLNCPQTAENTGFVNEFLLKSMKPTAYLINTSRGGLIDENSLAQALQQGKLAGAALDVLSKEPPSLLNPLLNLPNCMITPHTAWLSREARSRIMLTTIENVKNALDGTPKHVVN